MQIDINFLDNLKLEALFDDYKVLTDQPIRYKGDASAPSPFDYFLASSALCAAYFVRVYCKARDISTEGIKLSQNNIIDPENRYKQTFHIQISLPEHINQKDREAILKAMDRCTVKKVIQNSPKFKIEANQSQNQNIQQLMQKMSDQKIISKDASAKETIQKLTSLLNELDINIEIASWRNLVSHVWSVHIRDADSPMCFSNGKGSTKEAAICSALGEYLERIATNYFYNDFYLGQELAQESFVHYPSEKWFQIPEDNSLPTGLMDDYLLNLYNSDHELKATHLIDTNSGHKKRGICALPFKKYSTQEQIYIPVNIIGNLFVSNGMSAGNTLHETRVQALAEILERAVKNKIITEEISLPDVPQSTLNEYPHITSAIAELEDRGFPILIKDASLGGKFPVMCVTLLNPKNGGVFASFGSHPRFEVALERSLTELLQGRSFEGLNDIMRPTFNSHAVNEPNNIIDHFIDSTGIISWKFFSSKSHYNFVPWNFKGTTQEEFNYLISIFEKLEKEVYIADYQDLGGFACRILVPGFSEIYPVDDLIWDNNNRSLEYRRDILNLHQLSEQELKELYYRLESSDFDDHMPISELIGVAFDENTSWGQLDIGELKTLIALKLNEFETAKEQISIMLSFNEKSSERLKFYELANIMLDIELDSLSLKDYHNALTKMYGTNLYSTVKEHLHGESAFFDLPTTDMNLKGQDKHLKLIKSYKKLHRKRKQNYKN